MEPESVGLELAAGDCIGYGAPSSIALLPGMGESEDESREQAPAIALFPGMEDSDDEGRNRPLAGAVLLPSMGVFGR